MGECSGTWNEDVDVDVEVEVDVWRYEAAAGE